MRGFTLVLLAPVILAGCLDSGPTDVTGSSLPGLSPSLGPDSPRTTTVLTRNLYLGGDIGPLLGAEDPVAAAAAIWNEIQYTNFPARAAALAQEIAEIRPDVVGLQEAVRFTVGPFPSAGFPQGPLLDYLAVLQANLAAIGESYSVAAYHPNTQVAFPLPLNNSLVTIGFQDGIAILVRDGVETANAYGQTYAAMPPVEYTAGIPFRRGWTQVDAQIGGEWVRFVNTHLEIQSFAPIQVAQATELVGALDDSPYPVILMGDFNSAANDSAPAGKETASYGLIQDAGFEDLWARGEDPDSGLTCCHPSDLTNETATFDQRLDIIFARNRPGRRGGYAGASFLAAVGGDVDDRFTAPQGYSLWPSDHAGVAATLRLPPGLF